MPASAHTFLTHRSRGRPWGPALTRCDAGVLQLTAVVGAAALVQPGVGRGAAVAQRARAAADGGVQGVEVLRTLEALVVVALHVHPTVAVLSRLLGSRRAPAHPAQKEAERQQRPHRRRRPGLREGEAAEELRAKLGSGRTTVPPPLGRGPGCCPGSRGHSRAG